MKLRCVGAKTAIGTSLSVTKMPRPRAKSSPGIGCMVTRYATMDAEPLIDQRWCGSVTGGNALPSDARGVAVSIRTIPAGGAFEHPANNATDVKATAARISRANL